MDEKKKKIVISICSILILVLAITGISYAAFKFIGQGEHVNQITTGTISMSYAEGTNVIRLNNALPTTDATGKVRLNEGEYFDFSVITNISGPTVINWEIAAEDFSDNTFDGSNVKFYLTKLVDGNEIEVSSSLPAVYSEEILENKNTGRPANQMSLLTGSTSTQGEEIVNYRLRLYVDENYNPQGDGGGLVFRSRINVYGKVENSEILGPPIMKVYKYNSTDDYHATEYKSKVTNIVTKTNTIIPSSALAITNGKGNYWDVSEAGDDSVVAYIEDDGSGVGTYKVTIGANGNIVANSDSKSLFSAFGNLKNIDLIYLDTSNATTMFSMFNGCSSLISVDVSNFDTSNVTDMGNMFYGCSSLTNLDLSHLDISNVTDMYSMFRNCSSLVGVNISNFNTSNVTRMGSMFRGCSSLTNLDLSHFVTLRVTDMSEMFRECSSLSSVDVSNFNTSSVTSMSGMFQECSNLISLDINNFNTSNVTVMSSMFRGCNKLTSINVSSFNTLNVTKMDYMFQGCGSLTNLDLRSFDTTNVSTFGYMFHECGNLTQITVSSGWNADGKFNYLMFYNCGTDHVTSV